MNDRQLRKLQKGRHLADVQRMILSNPLFKNLGERDRKKLASLIYKAETIEIYGRERSIATLNASFDQIVDAVSLVLNEMDDYDDEDEEDKKQ